MNCEQGLLHLLWGGGAEVGVLRHWLNLNILVDFSTLQQLYGNDLVNFIKKTD